MNLRLLLVMACLFPLAANADSMRCGSKLVTNGDSVARLLKTCGKPAMKYRANHRSKRSGKSRSAQQWVYERGRRSSMVVSVLDGRVVQIRRE